MENDEQVNEGHESLDTEAPGWQGAASPMLHLSLTMSGESAELIAETLESVVLPMLKGGVMHAENESESTGVDFHYVIRKAIEAGIFMDGEGTLVGVNPEGDIIGLIRPDGTEDETAQHLRMSGKEWAELHGGISDIHTLKAEDRLPTRAQIDFLAKKMLHGIVGGDESPDWP